MSFRSLIALVAAGMTFAVLPAFGEQADTLRDQARIDRKAAAALRERGDADSVRAAAELERRAAEAERRAESLRSLGGAADATRPADAAPPAVDAGQSRRETQSSVTASDRPAQSEAERRRAASAVLDAEQSAKARALSAQGKALFQQNEKLAARIRLQGALDIDPANAEAHLYLGEVYRAEGQRTKAEEHYALAKDLDPDSAEAAIALARLQTLRAGPATAAAAAILEGSDVKSRNVASERDFSGTYAIVNTCSMGTGTGTLTIRKVNAGEFVISGRPNGGWSGGNYSGSIGPNGFAMKFSSWINNATYTVVQLTPGRLEGTYSQTSGSEVCNWVATRQ